MTLFDLLFLVSGLFVVGMTGRIAVSAIRGRWDAAIRLGRLLGLFLALYAAVLMCVALVLPRRIYSPGEQRCFDDWCVTALGATASAATPCGPDESGRDWAVTVEVNSVARRIRQRAPDAHAELEDQEGKRYRPCTGTASGKSLSDELGPGESFRVSLPFRLPRDATPTGLVLHHGDFPGAVIIGADQSFLHRPALQRLTVERDQKPMLAPPSTGSTTPFTNRAAGEER
jgi:hypothetical protein